MRFLLAIPRAAARIALNNLPKWTAEAAIRKKILVDNPARLHGFEAA